MPLHGAGIRLPNLQGTSGGACVGAMLLASPQAFGAALEHYTSGALWASMVLPRDLISPHGELHRAVVVVEARPRTV